MKNFNIYEKLLYTTTAAIVKWKCDKVGKRSALRRKHLGL